MENIEEVEENLPKIVFTKIKTKNDGLDTISYDVRYRQLNFDELVFKEDAENKFMRGNFEYSELFKVDE